MRPAQPFLQQLGAGRAAIVEGSDLTITSRVVVVGIDHYLAGQGLDGNVANCFQRNRYNHQITGRGGLLGGASTSLRAQFRHQSSQGFRPP
jgi:hypothetical protein